MNLEKLDAVRETPAFALLKKRLCELRAGEVAEIGPVAAQLAGCWHEFWGADSERVRSSARRTKANTSDWSPRISK